MFSYLPFIDSTLVGKSPLQEELPQRIAGRLQKLKTKKELKHNRMKIRETSGIQRLTKFPEIPPSIHFKKKSILNIQVSEKDKKIRGSPSNYNRLSRCQIHGHRENYNMNFNSLDQKRRNDLKLKQSDSKVYRYYQASEKAIMDSLERANRYIPLTDQPRNAKVIKIPNSVSPRVYKQSFSPHPRRNTPIIFKFTEKQQQKQEIEVTGQKTLAEIQFGKRDKSYSDLYGIMKGFSSCIERLYKKSFRDIDIGEKKYIVKEDIINMLISKALAKRDQIEYEKISKISQTVIEILRNITHSLKIREKDYLGMCSVYQHNKPFGSDLLDLTRFQQLDKLSLQVQQLKELFSLYAYNGVIRHKELVEYQKQIIGFQPCLYVLSAEKIRFQVFLKYLPVFLWMHRSLVSKFYPSSLENIKYLNFP